MGSRVAPTLFGHTMLHKHFLIEDTYVNLNHGSFGSTVRLVRDAMRSFQDASEAAPDRYVRYEYPQLLDESRAAAADFLDVPMEDLVIVPNATTAVNAVLRNLVFKKGELILYVDTIYGACLKTIDYITETTLAESVKVEFECPISDDELIERFQKTLVANRGRVKIALFDTIASLPGVRLPYERMLEVARKEGVLTLVDAAHGIGHLPLNLRALDPDFLTSNCHKWLYTPRGSAILYVPKRNQHIVRSSLPTSHFFEPRPLLGKTLVPNPLPPSSKSNFVQQFEFVGSVDNASLLCIPKAIEFRRNFCGGEEAIMSYCWKLASEGGALVADMLGTEIMDNSEGTHTKQCAMVMVRLPIHVSANDNPSAGGIALEQAYIVTAQMHKVLVEDYHTFIALTFYKGRWWARFCAQIYLELSDFEWGGKILKNLCEVFQDGLVDGGRLPDSFKPPPRTGAAFGRPSKSVARL